MGQGCQVLRGKSRVILKPRGYRQSAPLRLFSAALRRPSLPMPALSNGQAGPCPPGGGKHADRESRKGECDSDRRRKPDQQTEYDQVQNSDCLNHIGIISPRPLSGLASVRQKLVIMRNRPFRKVVAYRRGSERCRAGRQEGGANFGLFRQGRNIGGNVLGFAARENHIHPWVWGQYGERDELGRIAEFLRHRLKGR